MVRTLSSPANVLLKFVPAYWQIALKQVLDSILHDGKANLKLYYLHFREDYTTSFVKRSK